MRLREYQCVAVDRARSALRQHHAVLLVAPTGSGKTVIGANIVSRSILKQKRVLFVAHRRELINQTIAKLADAGIPAELCSVLMGDDKRHRAGAQITIASIQTWLSRANRAQCPDADLVIIDEAHRSCSAGYVRLVAHYRERGARIVGLTATPCRGDGRGLGDIYESLEIVTTPRALMDEGFLVCPRVFAPKSPLPDLSQVAMRGGDYAEGALQIVMNNAQLVGSIVDEWQKRELGRTTIVYATGIAHSKAIVQAFSDVGVAAEHLDGETPTLERDALLARLASGETQVVSNCGVLTEGYDLPRAKIVVIARPTKSLALHLQMCGRALRPYGDAEALILDHAGNSYLHGLPQQDRDWVLAPSKPKRGKLKPPTKTCPQCMAIVVAVTRTCPECGFQWPAHELRTEEDRELEELQSPEATTLRVRRLAGLCSPKTATQLARRGLNPDVTEELGRYAIAMIIRHNWHTPPELKADPRFALPSRKTA